MKVRPIVGNPPDEDTVASRLDDLFGFRNFEGPLGIVDCVLADALLSRSFEKNIGRPFELFPEPID